MATTELCPKCEKEPAGKSKDRWCKGCRARYQREYNGVKESKARLAGFAAGIEAMRATLAAEFARWQWTKMTGSEVAHVIRQAPRPKPPEV